MLRTIQTCNWLTQEQQEKCNWLTWDGEDIDLSVDAKEAFVCLFKSLQVLFVVLFFSIATTSVDI